MLLDKKQALVCCLMLSFQAMLGFERSDKPLDVGIFPECKNVQGHPLCRGLGKLDASGKVQDLAWCSNDIVHSFTNALTNHLFSSLKNVFNEPLDKQAIDYTTSILKCIERVVEHYGKKDKDLLKAFNQLSTHLHHMINTTLIIYNIAFKKAGPIPTTARELGEVANGYQQIIKDVNAAIAALEKTHFFYSDKKTLKNMLVQTFNVLKEVTNKVSVDLSKQIAQRKFAQ